METTERTAEGVKAKRIRRLFPAAAVFSLSFFLVFLPLAGCGGGGGGGGSGSSPSIPGGGEGIVLESITFPAWTDFSDPTPDPPAAAPLSQQVIFTFSGVPDGPDRVVIDSPPGYGALQIYALLPEDYNGPDAVVDRENNTIPARGTYEKFANRIVFTPSFPTEQIDFSPGASRAAVPGLLPEMEYIVYVPIGVGGTITNLKGVGKTVSNPIRFTSVSAELPNLFFSNHPAKPPLVTDHYPLDGDENVAINTLRDGVSGFEPWKDFFISFDQPLYPSAANVKGEGLDVDGDGVDDENFFCLYSPPRYLSVLDAGSSRDPAVVAVDRRTGSVETVGVTRLAVAPYTIIGLNSVVIDGSGRMTGSSGATLYTVEYKDLSNPGVCRLFQPRDLQGLSDVRGLALGPDGTLYALDGSTGRLLSVDSESGAVTVLIELGLSNGIWQDLAARADGLLYALAVSDPGGASPWSTVEWIDPGIKGTGTVYSGPGDYASLCLKGFSRLSLYDRSGPGVDLFDLEQGVLLPGEHYEIAGLEAGSPLNIDDAPTSLGTWATLDANGYTGSRVLLRPSGILPFGEKIDLMVRRGLLNISFGSLAAQEGRSPAEAYRVCTFTTIDHAGTVEDSLYEDFLGDSLEGSPMDEVPALPPALWNVQDVDGEPPLYEHLLATYGLSGGGVLGDFKPLGIYPTIILDTDYQLLPLFDGSTPDIRTQTVVRGGVFNFHDIIIPEGVTVKGIGSNPLVLTATGRVEIAGVIDVSGSDGMDDITFNSAFTPVPGGNGGPGGGRGGMGQPPVPPDFRFLTDLRSPREGEAGYGPGNGKRNGGRGGESGAKGTNVPYAGSSPDDDSRGAGGGGGSFLQKGGMGYHGRGKWGADPYSPDRYYIRKGWFFDDGHPNPPVPSEHRYMTQDPRGGDPGDAPFADGDPGNDYIGPDGEIKTLRGGQGGGAGGSRLDSMNPATVPLAANNYPPLDRSAYDAKGGGGGGGGGALGIYALDSIEMKSTGVILARGGHGGGGEVIGHSNFGGGAGGGSGGAVILDSAQKIKIPLGSQIDVSGGWPGDAAEKAWTPFSNQNWTAWHTNKCTDPSSNHRQGFCAWSPGDGGYGGYGIVQLEVPDPNKDLFYNKYSIFAELCQVDWMGESWGADAICDGSGSHCKDQPPKNCFSKYYHYKVNYTPNSSLPSTLTDPNEECLVDPFKTPTTLGPFSYGLSKWIDMGQTVFRDPIGGLPAPRFLDFRGIDKVTGRVITLNGYIPDPNPERIDIAVDAPDWDHGTANYIPEENDVLVLFQGADPIAPGSKVPDPGTMTAWTADLESLSGRQFIRFRVTLDTAKDPFVLSPTSPKPQVDFVRIRVQY